MKQNVGPAVIGAVVVVAVIIFVFFGWRMFFSGPKTGGSKPAEAVDNAKLRQQYQNYGMQRPGGFGAPTGAGPGMGGPASGGSGGQ
jgi:hypothetical protein